MANEGSPKLKTQVSRNELERRWKAVRQAMKESALDFLIMQNYTDILGGYVKWFTDRSAHNNYPFSLIFARDEDMTIIAHGPRVTRESGSSCRGQETNWSAGPSFAGIHKQFCGGSYSSGIEQVSK